LKSKQTVREGKHDHMILRRGHVQDPNTKCYRQTDRRNTVA